MKYFLVLFLTSTSFYSQTGKITYSSVFNFAGGVNKTENELFFTKNASLYQPQIINDKKTVRDEKTQADSEDSKVVEINIKVGSDSLGSVYYHNLHEDYIVCRESLYENGKLKYFIYKDLAPIKWNLEDKFKIISEYKCQKATAQFRGRSYEAWFTSEIPLSFGPWKFHGLPGLILEVYDQTGEVYFSADRVKIPFIAADSYVKEPKNNAIITNKEFQEKKYQSVQKNTMAMLARSPEGSTVVSTKVKIIGIELEYEWEKE